MFLFFLTFVSENLLWDFRIKMFWKSLGSHPWFGSRSLFQTDTARCRSAQHFSFHIDVVVVNNKHHHRKVLFSSSLHVLFVADLTFIHPFQFCSTFQSLSETLFHDCNHKSKPDNWTVTNHWPSQWPLWPDCRLSPSLSHSLAQPSRSDGRLPWIHRCEKLPGRCAPLLPAVVCDHPEYRGAFSGHHYCSCAGRLQGHGRQRYKVKKENNLRRFFWYLVFTQVFIFLMIFYFYFLHFKRIICNFYSLHFHIWLVISMIKNIMTWSHIKTEKKSAAHIKVL